MRARSAPSPAAARPTRRKRQTRAQHGTEAEYRRGCGCELCKAAASTARAARKARGDREREIANVHGKLKRLQSTEPVAGKVANVDRETYSRYVAARQAAAEAELALLEAELAIKTAIGDAETVKVNGRKVGTWAMHARTFFDSAAFRAKHPALWERFQRPGKHRRFVVSQFAATPPARRAKAAQRGARR